MVDGDGRTELLTLVDDPQNSEMLPLLVCVRRGTAKNPSRIRLSSRGYERNLDEANPNSRLLPRSPAMLIPRRALGRARDGKKSRQFSSASGVFAGTMCRGRNSRIGWCRDDRGLDDIAEALEWRCEGKMLRSCFGGWCVGRVSRRKALHHLASLHGNSIMLTLTEPREPSTPKQVFHFLLSRRDLTPIHIFQSPSIPTSEHLSGPLHIRPG